ncbi:HDOD domain-containing protein [Endozoicomonas sp. SM1973]|uniref:HDOD domain-containing protein n=1 Tax=Spartinivicinus marinus TaxID=2994442 RepID=A0A853ICY8_9GAMM|nr:HDOD domain-containing protein [Spartinivicinus marinus]MCX4025505.1 HDOD domain-containing protein [Spartinivicinus marinus]NYZ65266.1 HDOD domain-containing protein [Spartinivicinus marinus]
MANLSERIEEEILDALRNDELSLPTLPEVALKVRETAEDPEAGVNELAKVISNDAAITARIIKVVNSPLMRTSREIDNIQMAVNRLGMTYSANLATGLAMEQMFQATSDVVDKMMRDVWSKSTEVAGICNVLCRHYTKLQPDQAMLAGLMHKIGALPVLTYVESISSIPDSITLAHVIEKTHPTLGTKILEAWDFPSMIAKVPEEYIKFDRNSPKVDYVDIVMVANLQSLVGTGHPYTEMDWSSIKAFEKLGLDPNVDMNEAEDLSDEMEAAMALLAQ